MRRRADASLARQMRLSGGADVEIAAAAPRIHLAAKIRALLRAARCASCLTRWKATWFISAMILGRGKKNAALWNNYFKSSVV